MHLLSPLTLLLLAIPVLLIAVWRRRRGLGLVSGLVALLAAAAMTPWVANALLGMVEARAGTHAAHCEDPQAVVLLSGGLDRPPRGADDLAALTPATIARVLGLLGRGGVHAREADDAQPRHAWRARGLPLVISGGGPFAVPEAEVVAGLLVALGVQIDGAMLETGSTTTWESAFAVRTLLPEDVRRIALASSALHLPRAMQVYRAAGFDVCPWSLGSQRLHPRGIGALTPQSSSLRKTEAALHELVGMAYYAARLRFAGARGGASNSR